MPGYDHQGASGDLYVKAVIHLPKQLSDKDWLKNRIGFFNLYLGAISLFTLGSLLCACSTNLESLLAARAIQALGGGAMAPTSMAIISYVFPARVRGAILGWWGLGNLVGPAIGPTLGGILTEKFGWPSIFYINLPIGVITIVMAFKYLGVLCKQPKIKLPFDIPGFTTLTIFLVCLQYGIAKAERVGVTSPQILITLGGALGIALLAIITQAAYNHHLLDGANSMRSHHLALKEGFCISLIILFVTLVPAWFMPRRNVIVKKRRSAHRYLGVKIAVQHAL